MTNPSRITYVPVGLASLTLEDTIDGHTGPVAAYDVVAAYMVTLSPLAREVEERKLHGLTLVRSDVVLEEDEQLELPTDLENLDKLIAVLVASRDYLAREIAEAGA